jgi:hypothetical protein
VVHGREVATWGEIQNVKFFKCVDTKFDFLDLDREDFVDNDSWQKVKDAENHRSWTPLQFLLEMYEIIV